MRSIHSQSIPLIDVIQDLAREFDAKVVKNCHEYYLKIPEDSGSGTIRGIDFKDGLGIILYDCTFKEELEIHFIIDRVHPLKFMFCEQGNLSHRFEHDVQLHEIKTLENIIVASSKYNGHILNFKAGTRTVLNSLEIDRKLFGLDVDCELKTLSKDLENLFRDVEAKNPFYYHGAYSFRMADLFREIHTYPDNGFLRRTFLEGSAYKILTLQILQHSDDMAEEENKTLLRKFEIKMVHQASQIINNDILDFKSVPELALEVGLNINKLQNGFRELYHTTVNEYVHNRRLDLASNLIKNSELTISEIVYLIGLSSRSYFSKIFKEKYGISPSVLRQNMN